MFKIIQIGAIALLVATIATWVYYSASYGEPLILTKNEKATQVQTSDPLFGTTITKTEIQPGYWMGLVDDKFPFGAATLSGIWVVVFLFATRMNRKERISQK